MGIKSPVSRATNKIIETWIRIPVIISTIPLSIIDLSNWTPFDLICSNENLKWITLVMCKIFGIQYLTYLYTSKYGAPINNDLDFCCSQRYWYNCDVILYYTVNKSYSSANKTILLIELCFNIISYFFLQGYCPGFSHKAFTKRWHFGKYDVWSQVEFTCRQK